MVEHKQTDLALRPDFYKIDKCDGWTKRTPKKGFA